MKPKKNRFFFTRQWWADLSTNFFGALLGIVVTFGTTGYLDYRDKRSMGRKTALMTISNIEFSIRTLDEVCQELRAQDTVFMRIREHYPDRLEQIAEDTLYMYINGFIRRQGFIIDPSAEGIFTHSSDIWRTLDNHTLQQRIGHCFATRNILYDYIVYMFQKQQDAAARFFDEKFLFDRESLAAAARELTDFPAVRDYMALYRGHLDILDSNLRELKRMNERNKQDMRITDEEFAEYLRFFDEDYDDDPDAAGVSDGPASDAGGGADAGSAAAPGAGTDGGGAAK